MQHSPKRFTITAALPYTNGPVHIGHLAGVYVPADIYSRFQRMQGNDVAFVCGSDEHGVPITIKAKKEGITPQQVVDKYHAIIKQSFQDFGLSSITIRVLQQKYITIRLPNSLKNYTKTVSLSNKLQSNSTIKKQINF